jgi:hypothetical protein
MIYTSLCLMLLMRAASITWASGRGLGPGNLEFFGSQMALAYRLDVISQGPKNSQFPGPKKLLISRANPPPSCPRYGCCPHQKHYAWGLNHRCINRDKKFTIFLQDAESLYFVLTYAKCGDFFTFLRKTIKKVSCMSHVLMFKT